MRVSATFPYEAACRALEGLSVFGCLRGLVFEVQGLHGIRDPKWPQMRPCRGPKLSTPDGWT